MVEGLACQCSAVVAAAVRTLSRRTVGRQPRFLASGKRGECEQQRGRLIKGDSMKTRELWWPLKVFHYVCLLWSWHPMNRLVMCPGCQQHHATGAVMSWQPQDFTVWKNLYPRATVSSSAPLHNVICKDWRDSPFMWFSWSDILEIAFK